MSLYFDVVICCDLREGTPQEVVDTIRYLSDPTFELKQKSRSIYALFGLDTDTLTDDYRFLISNPEHEVIASFQRKLRAVIPSENHREVYNWSLQYCGRNLLDDYAYECHFSLLYWLPQYVDGLVGYYYETTGSDLVRVVYSLNGTAKTVDVHLR